MTTLYARLRTALAAALLATGGAAAAQPTPLCADDAPPENARRAAPAAGLLDATPPRPGAALARASGGAPCAGAGRLAAATYDEAGRLLGVLYERWVVDAQAWVPSSRSTYAYGEGGRTTTVTSEAWNVATQAWVAAGRTTTTAAEPDGPPLRRVSERFQAGTWENDRETTYAWRADTLLTERADRRWADGEWRPTLRYAYDYDEAGRTTESLFQVYFASGAAVEDGSRSLYAYHPSGAPASFEYQKWSAEAQVWVPVERQTTSADGALTLAERWGAGVWSPSFRESRTFDDGRLAGSRTEVWRSDSEAWVLSGRLSVSYEAAGGGTVETHVRQGWVATDGAWVNAARTTYGRDAAGRQTLYRFERWSARDGAWYRQVTQRESFDERGNRTEWLQQRHPAGGGPVESGTRYLYAFDDDGRPTAVRAQAWDPGAQAWADAARWTYAYGRSVDAGPAPEAAPLALAVYPNPAVGPATLRLTAPGAADVRVEVYDALGRRVAVARGGPAATGPVALPLDAALLAPGVYAARAVADGRAVSRTFTVVR